MKKIFKKNFFNDKAEGVITPVFIIAAPMFILILGMVVNIGMHINSKIEYNEIAQRAAQASIMKINANGSLGNESIQSFVDTYNSQLSTSNVITSNECNKSMINGVERKLPYFEIKLDVDRKIGNSQNQVWSFSGEGKVPTQYINPSVKYRVLSADVYTQSKNLFSSMGISSCAPHKTSISSTAFGSNRDLSGTGTNN